MHNYIVSFRCVSLPENDTCTNSIGTYANESYAIDVAQTELNIAIVNAMKSARSALALESDVDSSCITIVDWIICLYRFPLCLGTKLILPCIETCETLLGFFVTCYGDIEKHIDDITVRDYFREYRCRVAESYYDGYDHIHFITIESQSSNCISLPDG